MLLALVWVLGAAPVRPDSSQPWRKYTITLPAPATATPPAATTAPPATTIRVPPGTVPPWSTPKSWDISLVAPDEPGPRFEMRGRVLRPDSRPAAGIKLYVYHADAKGWYARQPGDLNRVAGVLRTNARGEYRIRSVVPGMYDGPGHVHIEVWDGAHPRSTTFISLSALPGVPPVPTWKSTRTATREWTSTMGLLSIDSSGTYHCHRDLRLADMTPAPASYDSVVQVWRRAAGRPAP